jgi:hypothetical protein
MSPVILTMSDLIHRNSYLCLKHIWRYGVIIRTLPYSVFSIRWEQNRQTGDFVVRNSLSLRSLPTKSMIKHKILWNVGPLLGSGPVNSKRETVFSSRSVPRCYKQDKLVETNPSSRQRGCYIWTMTASVQFKKKVSGRESQEARRQDELVGGKSPVVK